MQWCPQKKKSFLLTFYQLLNGIVHEEVLLLIFVKSRRSRCFNAINTSERKEILIRFVFKSFSTFFFSTKTFLAASSLLVVTFFSSWFHFVIFHGSPCALLFNVCLGFFCCAAFCCATSSPLICMLGAECGAESCTLMSWLRRQAAILPIMLLCHFITQQVTSQSEKQQSQLLYSGRKACVCWTYGNG